MTSVDNARGDTEHYNFDADGNLTSVQNGNGYYRYYYYTYRGELKQILFADGTNEQYKFDGNGNQTRRINGLSQTIQYAYDDTDNLTTVTYPTGTPTTLAYDYDGRQTNMVDSTGTSSWTYDNGDNVTQLVTPQGTMDYVYDQWNRRTKLTEGGNDTLYTYTNEKLTGISKSADGVSTTFGYDAYGRLTSKNDGATSTSYDYDGNDRLNYIAHSNASGVFHQETYNYNYVNNLTSKVVNSVSTSYTYDDIDQLLTESQSGGYSYGYTYDHNGNRLTKTSGINVDTYTYDHADKLQSLAKSNGTAYYNWDNAGRMTSVTGLYTRNFTWDYDDRMTSATVYGTTATNYTYNGVGTRTAKSGPFGSRTYKRDGVGVTAPVLSDGLASMVPGISEKTGSTTNFVHTDRLGSMKAMSTAGTVTDTATYDAFGNATHVGSSLTQKGFAANYGYQEDAESGLKLLGHRYYDPETGRFISRDPAFAGRNWFAYCHNNPLKAVDPNGLDEEKFSLIGISRILSSMPTWLANMIARAMGYADYNALAAAAVVVSNAASGVASGGGEEAALDEAVPLVNTGYHVLEVEEDSLEEIIRDAANNAFRSTTQNFPANANPGAVGFRTFDGKIQSYCLYDDLGERYFRQEFFSRRGRLDHLFPEWHSWHGDFEGGGWSDGWPGMFPTPWKNHFGGHRRLGPPKPGEIGSMEDH